MFTLLIVSHIPVQNTLFTGQQQMIASYNSMATAYETMSSAMVLLKDLATKRINELERQLQTALCRPQQRDRFVTNIAEKHGMNLRAKNMYELRLLDIKLRKKPEFRHDAVSFD